MVAEIPTILAGKVPYGKPKFYTTDVSWMNIVVDGPVYIGPSWVSGDAGFVYLAMDRGPRTVRRRGFSGAVLFEDEIQPPSKELGIRVGDVPEYRAFGIRAKFAPLLP